MKNPYYIANDDKEKAIIAGYVISIKDMGDYNVLLFKEDTTDSSSGLVSVAAWGPKEGQNGEIDLKKSTDDLKGRFVVCICRLRKKFKEGKTYNNYDLKYLIKAPKPREVV